MSTPYSSSEFRTTLLKRLNNHLPPCKMCGGMNFTTSDEYLALLSEKEYGRLNIGPTVPVGVIICTHCGHVEFFSLGILGLLPKDNVGGGKNAEKED